MLAPQTHFYCSCDLDLDLDPMTLIYELDLTMLKLYFHTNSELSRSRLSEARALTNRQTNATENITTPLGWW